MDLFYTYINKLAASYNYKSHKRKLKKTIILLTSFLMISCWQSAYRLSEGSDNRDYLINYIKNLKKDGKMTNNPVLVLNGEMITYDSLKKCNLKLFKRDIDSIYGVFKKDDEGAIHIYGRDGKNGVILVHVKKYSIECK